MGRKSFSNNEIPQGTGGEKIEKSVTSQKEVQDHSNDYLELENNNDSKTYTMKDYSYLQGDMFTLFNELRKRILNLSVDVREELKKYYIAYKLTSNFVDVEPFKIRSCLL